MAQNQGQGSLFESYETSYCAAATSVSNSLAALSTLPLGAPGFLSIKKKPSRIVKTISNQIAFFIRRTKAGKGQATR